MPFLTESVWEHLSGGKGGLLISAPWPDCTLLPREHAAMEELDWVVSLISAVRTARAELNVPAAAELAATLRIEGAEVETRIRGHGEAIRRLARLKSIVPKPEAGTARAVQVVVEGATLFLDLAGAIDFDRERARLQKEAKDAAAELERIERKLQNPQFVAKAKAEVIEEQREREVEARAALARIEAALKRLS